MVFTLITQRTDIIPNFKSFTVLSGSMEPEIRVGSIVYTYQSPSYAKNDVITFKRDGINVTHRIFAVKQINTIVSYQTRGDANTTIDPQLVPISDIYGKVYLTIPFLGIFSAYLKTFPGFMLCIALPIIFFIILEIITIKKEMEKEIEKKVLQKHHLYET